MAAAGLESLANSPIILRAEQLDFKTSISLAVEGNFILPFINLYYRLGDNSLGAVRFPFLQELQGVSALNVYFHNNETFLHKSSSNGANQKNILKGSTVYNSDLIVIDMTDIYSEDEPYMLVRVQGPKFWSGLRFPKELGFQNESTRQFASFKYHVTSPLK